MRSPQPDHNPFPPERRARPNSRYFRILRQPSDASIVPTAGARRPQATIAIVRGRPAVGGRGARGVTEEEAHRGNQS
jgi:hypothetical protein